MALLAGKVYDPSTLATASTASLLAMTALDTTNLRLSFNAPANGKSGTSNVFCRMRVPWKGAATTPQILLGVMDGSTVKLRLVPTTWVRSFFSASVGSFEAVGCILGLTPAAALNYDLAYGVEVVVASTQLGWGGPDDTTSGNAYSGACFEIWDAPNLLACKVYDPSTAGSLAVGSAASKLTAIDTTNLRLTFTTPASGFSGNVLVRLRGVLTGSASGPSTIFLGVLDGATIKGRSVGLGNTNQSGTLATTDRVPFEASFVVTGLSANTSYTWDAAVGVEDQRASNTLQYGGPNNATTNDAWGAFVFEVWDAS